MSSRPGALGRGGGVQRPVTEHLRCAGPTCSNSQPPHSLPVKSSVRIPGLQMRKLESFGHSRNRADLTPPNSDTCRGVNTIECQAPRTTVHALASRKPLDSCVTRPATASQGPKPSSSSRYLWSEARDSEYLIHHCAS